MPQVKWFLTRFATLLPLSVAPSGSLAALLSAVVMSLELIEGSMMPYSFEGAISFMPPTSVAIGAVPQAAASKRTVEKPSDREGRQK